MQFIDAAAIRGSLTFPALIDALEAAHRRPKIEVHDAWLGEPRAHYFVRSAVEAGRFMLTKAITSFPGNLAGGSLPAVQAVCILFDGADGRPLAALDGTEITSWRTAADSALGARYLAPPHPETLLMAGAGQMAPWLVRAHRAERPSLARVLIWNRTPARADLLAKELRNEGVAASAVEDLAIATAEADVISACTRSLAPIIEGARLKPGAHLDLVGGYNAQTREADDEAARRALVFADRRESALDVGDILQPLASGALGEAGILGDLYDLASGRGAGRRSAQDITLFKNAGGAHLDLMTCEAVLRRLGALAPDPF
jgi:ornithine cyclodeaminase/alanine dehydrogenase-like protein (mu-crystallin family)